MSYKLHTVSIGVILPYTYLCPPTAGAINLLGDVSHMTLPELEEMGMGLNVGVQWEEALHAALMPVTPQCSMGSLAESEFLTHCLPSRPRVN